MSDGRDDVSFVFEIGLLSVLDRWSVVHRRHEVRDYEQRPWRKKKHVTMLVAGMTHETLAFVARRIYKTRENFLKLTFYIQKL